MKITKRKIMAASDYRTFDGLALDELFESNPDLYYDYFHDIRFDVDEALISRNPNCPYIGVIDKEGKHYVYKNAELGEEGPGWYEVSFAELFDYLK